MKFFRLIIGTLSLAVLVGCGGGGGGGGSNPSAGASVSLGLSEIAKIPSASLPFVQAANNLKLVVDSGPTGFANANILYATVTVCEPGSASKCQVIDHVQVDTGSVGLRVLASKVSSLNLPHIQTVANTDSWECYPFVVGGLWGVNATADVGLGQQVASGLPIQIIQDTANPSLQVPADCSAASNGQILNSQVTLGANGIIGIGSMPLDCGGLCQVGDYSASPYAQYRGCPVGAVNSSACSPIAVPSTLQVHNPIADLPAAYNNGAVILLPDAPGLGSVSASGQLVFGMSDSVVAALAKVNVGVDYVNNPNSYMGVTTQYNNQTISYSYLDTGSNGLFFSNASIPLCQSTSWYCPTSQSSQTAVISDGDIPSQNKTPVSFVVGNASSLFSTSNAAFSDLTGSQPVGSNAFTWGLPFFFGKKVFLSIWGQRGSSSGPWYSWIPG